jgi:hypothetical protein
MRVSLATTIAILGAVLQSLKKLLAMTNSVLTKLSDVDVSIRISTFADDPFKNMDALNRI